MGAGLVPLAVGGAAADAFLEKRALEPDLWDATNADLGFYSTPSYRFDASILEADRGA